MKALVVGGEHTFVRDVLGPRLSDVGIELGSIWDWDHSKPIQSIPKGCDCVIVVKDMTNHTQRDVARALAKRGGLPFAEIPRKWAVAYQDLLRAGLIKQGHGEKMGRRKKTAKLVLQEDYSETLARIASSAKRYYEKNGRRPKANEVAKDLNIPTFHVALQRGINQGIANAKGVAFKEPDETPLNELVEMALQDNPEWILDLDGLNAFMSEMYSKKGQEAAALKKRVVNLALSVQKRWRRASDKRNTHPEKVFVRGLQQKWAEALLRDAQNQGVEYPQPLDLNVESHSIFKTWFSKRMYEQALEAVSQPAEVEVEPALEVMEFPEVPAHSSEPVSEVSEVSEVDEQAADVENVVSLADHTRERTYKDRASRMTTSLKERMAKYFHMLGQVPDKEVAELAGVSSTSVCRYRNSLGIAACRRGKGRVIETPEISVGYNDTSALIRHSEAPPLSADLAVRLGEVESKLSSTFDQNGQLADEVASLAHLVTQLREQIAEMPRTSVMAASTYARAENESLGSHIDSLIAKGFKVNISIEAGE